MSKLVYLLVTYLANFAEGFHLSLTTYQFTSKQHTVICINSCISNTVGLLLSFCRYD